MSKSLLASAGLVAAIVGFAAKDVLSNFVSGVIIILLDLLQLHIGLKLEMFMRDG